MSSCKSHNDDTLRLDLKPRCHLSEMAREVKESKSRTKNVELNVYKCFMRDLRDKEENELDNIFDSVAGLPLIQSIVLQSKGSGAHTIPVRNLVRCLNGAPSLQRLHVLHIKLRGTHDEFDDLSLAFHDHTCLKEVKIHIEDLENIGKSIEALERIPTLEEVEILTSRPASASAELDSAFQALFASKSMKRLFLSNIALRFERVSAIAKLLGANDVLEELTLECGEVDVHGAIILARMLQINNRLQRVRFSLDTFHGTKLGEELIEALDTNETLQFFQLEVDGRMADSRAVRESQKLFRTALSGKYSVQGQVGLKMGVTCERTP